MIWTVVLSSILFLITPAYIILFYSRELLFLSHPLHRNQSLKKNEIVLIIPSEVQEIVFYSQCLGKTDEIEILLLCISLQIY